MRAAVVGNGTVTVREVPDPAPRPGELLVRVTSAGINAADLLQRAGLYPAPAGSPTDIPGLEFAGEVVATGGGWSAYKLGDRVMAVVGGGGQAELAVVHESHALLVPKRFDLEVAGGFPEAFSTAHDALVTQARMTSSDRVLITGAAGGVGTAAIQVAAALGGTVVASARDESKHPALVDLGADMTITPDQTADAGPFDVVLELVGGASLAETQRSLARFARVAVIGVGGGGARVDLDLLGVMQRRITLTGSTLRSRSVEEKAQVAASVRRGLLPLLGSGAIRVPVQSVVPLDDVSAAYDEFAAGGKFGKFILNVSEGTAS
jgi:NADPH:quinone reductase-like Zn-dependent oxidoreductase